MMISSSITEGSVCPAAETKLIAAMHNNGEGVILVNDSLLVKMRGRFLGLALENGRCPIGSMECGRWYYPKEFTTREAIRDAYIAGHTEITIDDVTEWSRYRRLRGAQIDLLIQADAARNALYEGRRSSLFTPEQRSDYLWEDYEGPDSR